MCVLQKMPPVAAQACEGAATANGTLPEGPKSLSPTSLLQGLLPHLVAAQAREGAAAADGVLPEGAQLALLRARVAGEVHPRVAQIAADPVVRHVLPAAADGAEAARHVLRVRLLIVQQEHLHVRIGRCEQLPGPNSPKPLQP